VELGDMIYVNYIEHDQEWARIMCERKRKLQARIHSDMLDQNLRRKSCVHLYCYSRVCSDWKGWSCKQECLEKNCYTRKHLSWKT